MNKSIFKLVLLFSITLISTSCNNDDDNNPQTCTTQGLFYRLGSSNLSALEADLTTDLFPNNSIDPVTNQSVPAVEIFGNDSNGDFVVFVTEVLTVNATGTAELIIGNGNSETINVTCLVTDTVVGGAMRFEISGTYNSTALSGEYCVTIDSVNP